MKYYSAPPANTESMMYIVADGFYKYSLAEIVKKCRNKWPRAKMHDLHIEFQEIKRDSLLYSESSKVNVFIVITYNP